MVRRTSESVKRLFPDDFKEIGPSERAWWKKFEFNTLMSGWMAWVMGLFFTVFVLFGCHYWNAFKNLETNVITEYAQVGVCMQLRKDVFINLARTVIDYAKHEREMVKYVVDERRGSAKSVDPKKLAAFVEKHNVASVAPVTPEKIGSFLGDFRALAENYPQLKLSENFQVLMQSLIAVEKKITEHRFIYNENRRIFMTYIRKIPQCFYAFIFRTRNYDYIDVDPDLSSYSHIVYE